MSPSLSHILPAGKRGGKRGAGPPPDLRAAASAAPDLAVVLPSAGAASPFSRRSRNGSAGVRAGGCVGGRALLARAGPARARTRLCRRARGRRGARSSGKAEGGFDGSMKQRAAEPVDSIPRFASIILIYYTHLYSL